MASVITAVVTARLQAASAAQLRPRCRSGRQATARALPCARGQARVTTRCASSSARTEGGDYCGGWTVAGSLGRTRSSWLRELMPSLVKTLCRWYLAVRALMNSRAAALLTRISTAGRVDGRGHDDEAGARSLSRSDRLPEQAEHEKSCSADASAAANAGCRSPRSMRTWARFSRARSAFTDDIWLIADIQAAIAAGWDKPRRSGVTARPSGSSSPPSSNSMTPLQSRLQPCLG